MYYAWEGRAQQGRGAPPWYEVKPPLDEIPPQYVPQVQLEMLALGSNSNNFVSATAHQGLNLITAERDDHYLGEMLHFIASFWRCVRTGVPPTEDMHWSEPERFAAFLDATMRLGGRREMHVAQPWRWVCSAGSGTSLFLDANDTVE